MPHREPFRDCDRDRAEEDEESDHDAGRAQPSVAQPDGDRYRDQHRHDDRERQRGAFTVVQQVIADAEVDFIVRARFRPIEPQVAEPPRQRQRVRTLVLQRALIERCGVVERGVIALQAALGCEVHPGKTARHELRQVGVVGQPFVDCARERGPARIARGARELIDEPRVRVAGLEHQRRPPVAAHLEIQRHFDLVQLGIVIDEALGPDEPQLFAVGEQDQQIVAQRRSRLERADGFEDRRDRRRVVARTGAARHRVVVGREHHRPGAIGPADSSDDIVRGREQIKTPPAAGGSDGLPLRIGAERVEPFH